MTLAAPLNVPNVVTQAEAQAIIALKDRARRTIDYHGVNVFQEFDSELLADKLRVLIEMANASHFKMNLDDSSLFWQLVEYPTGVSWERHADNMTGGPQQLTISIQLCGPDDYRGGDLMLHTDPPIVADRGLGSAIIFDSFIEHEILPVTSGTRYCLVAWVKDK